MRQFPASPITALIDGKPRYYLGESMARDLAVADLLGPGGLASLAEVNLGYGTSAGDPALRALLAAWLRRSVAAPAHLRVSIQGLWRTGPARRLADRARPRAVRASEVTGPGAPSAHKGPEHPQHIKERNSPTMTRDAVANDQLPPSG